MDNLKKQSEVLKLLHKRKECEIESISVELNDVEQRLSADKLRKKSAVFELKSCREGLLAGSGEKLDVLNMIAMHSYASKIEQDIDLIDKQIAQKNSELDTVREKLEKKLTEGKLYEKAVEKKENLIQRELESIQENESQELWLSGRVNR
ncbi:MAG: hypothetical protein OQJ89_08120 [Kangiellaceae bacterium]|nr:hypothetical protein [Kangiellaceae bacterium]MCW8997670.1 hypothetical protein [Kangiellaceae bacterium]MCW9016913.1 hypothetical protein [Kangiellaceae bacterium]